MRVYVSACISVIKEGRPGRESEGEGRGRRERTWREMERNRGRGGRERERSAREEEENGRAGRESREGEEGGGRNLKEGGKGRGGKRKKRWESRRGRERAAANTCKMWEQMVWSSMRSVAAPRTMARLGPSTSRISGAISGHACICKRGPPRSGFSY
jgi:hypothetical protein